MGVAKTATTALGRSVRASVDGGTGTATTGHERHQATNSLRDVILGGQDGLVNMLGIALGVVAAGGSTHVLVVTGLAAAITESIPMGAGGIYLFRFEPRLLSSREGSRAK